MTAARRTDAHRPAAIDPADYGYVGCFVNTPPTDLEGNEADVENPAWPVPGFEPLTFSEALGAGRSPERAYPGETDRCDHCGQPINFAAVYRHLPTGQFVALGHRCADAVMGFEDRRALRASKQRDLVAAVRKDAREEAERRGRLEEARRRHPAAYEVLDGYDGPNRFIADVAGRLAETGDLTDSQAEKVVEAHERDRERVRRREAGEEEPVPSGEDARGAVVEGVVVKAEERDDPYAGRWGRRYRVALTVRDDRGFVVWGHAPEALHGLDAPEGRRDVGKGDRVRFAANLEPKGRDPYFGFFKRPRKAEVVAFAEPEGAPDPGPEPEPDAHLGAAVEDVRREVRDGGGAPDALTARQAVDVLDDIVGRGREGGVMAWWRQRGPGRPGISAFREAWDERRRDLAVGAHRELRGLAEGGSVEGASLAGHLERLADLYVGLGGDPKDVGR